MVSKVDNVLGMSLHANDDSDEIIVEHSGLSNPYLHYPGGDVHAGGGGADGPTATGESKPKGKKKSSSRSPSNRNYPRTLEKDNAVWCLRDNTVSVVCVILINTYNW